MLLVVFHLHNWSLLFVDQTNTRERDSLLTTINEEERDDQQINKKRGGYIQPIHCNLGIVQSDTYMHTTNDSLSWKEIDK